MPRQILTIELDGLTAGDYIAHLRDPEPPALGHGLRSVTVRADPLGTRSRRSSSGRTPSPPPASPPRPRGLPLVAEVMSVDATEVHGLDPADAPRARPGGPAPRRLSALTERAAQRLAAQARPATFSPQVLRWA